jgi:hypothetical protein
MNYVNKMTKCVSNYRPVSLLTSFSKVLGKVVYNRVLRHLNNNNNVLVEEHCRFRKKRTEEATYELIN